MNVIPYITFYMFNVGSKEDVNQITESVSGAGRAS